VGWVWREREREGETYRRDSREDSDASTAEREGSLYDGMELAPEVSKDVGAGDAWGMGSARARAARLRRMDVRVNILLT